MLLESFKMRASDIHIEPMETTLRIRYRVDGKLVEMDNHPKKLHPAIIARIIKRLFFILFPLLFIQCFAFFPIDRPEWPPHSTRVRRSILAIFIQLGK